MAAAGIRRQKLLAALLCSTICAGGLGASRAAEQDAADDEPEGPSAHAIAGWVVTSVAAAAFISATVTGALALHEHQQLAGLCENRICEPALHARVDQFNAFRLAATTSMIGAGITGVAGISLLLTAPSPEGSSHSAATTVRPPAAGTLWWQGTF